MVAKIHESQLTKLGFSEKEARVYISALELGSSPIQKIAENSGVKRATTYVMVRLLVDRGLMSTIKKGKKTFFTAESPRKIMKMLENEHLALEAKKRHFSEILSDLLRLGNETLEELNPLHEKVLATANETIEEDIM